jgi:hypothetical protein
LEEGTREEVAVVGVSLTLGNFWLILIHRWYNIPPDPSKLKASAEVVQESSVTQLDLENSRPLDFETFVPDHDPSLAQPSQAAFGTYGIPLAPGEHVSRDEAFNRALGAMYWVGYWTAIYHVSHITTTGWSDSQCADTGSRVMNIMTKKGSHMRRWKTVIMKKKERMRMRKAMRTMMRY